MRILVINGSLGGAKGNTFPLIERIRTLCESFAAVCDVYHLAERRTPSRADLTAADGFVFTTGTYWDSWGSPLQKFWEDVTLLEGDACWFGKPAAVLVSMHSVGGKGIASRLQGVINSFGLFVPPMGSLVYSMANQEALAQASGLNADHANDLWSVDDLDVLAKNLCVAAAAPRLNWISWPVDRSDPRRIWINLRHEKTT